MGRKDYKIVIAILIYCFALSCKKDSTTVGSTPFVDSENVYTICEGMLGNGDASLYLYHTSDKGVFGDIYKTANNQSLGDIFQSMTQIGNNFFLCINNSDKIIVINKTDWKQVNVISVPKPRYILSISPTKAYVSTLFSNKVYIINPQTFLVTGAIDMPHKNPEGMLLYNNAAYICTWDTTTNNVYKLDINTDKITDSFPVSGYAPQEIMLDKEQKLWILSGNHSNNKPAAFTRVDPASKSMMTSFLFAPDIDPIRPILNNTEDTVYFIEANYSGGTTNNGVYRMNIHDGSLPATAFIPAQLNQYFYAVGIEPITGNIYIGDPKGFTQKGSVYVYKTDGTIVSQFNVGVGPGHFYFYHQ